MKESQPQGGIRNKEVIQVRSDGERQVIDVVVTEEPLEMRIEYGPEADRKTFTLAITMRTPGHDEDLVRGFLYTEGIVEQPRQIKAAKSQDFGIEGYQSITAELHPDVRFDPSTSQRHFYTTSSCGVCGKASIDMVRQVTSFRLKPGEPKLPSSLLNSMVEKMRSGQPLFSRTGGIHAAAIFTKTGELLELREDVGRHNAVDKLIGAISGTITFPLDDHVLIVSGRGGFELVQKAVVCGVAIFAAVGAPSSLAVELAQNSDMTLIGFLRDDHFNIYSAPQRIIRTP